MTLSNTQLEDIIEKAKNDEGTDYYGVNYYRGQLFITSIGAVKKSTRREQKK